MTSSTREADRDAEEEGEPGDGGGAPRFRDLTARQRLLLAASVLALPLLLGAAAEGVLRAAGYGGSHPLFVPYPQDARYLVPNPEVGRRYFDDPEDAPRPHADLLERDKGPDTYRIVVQGASSAAGFPYYFGGSFSRMLRQRLQETFPGRRIEVVNVALDATNSYQILDLADEVAAVDPDAVLLYAGHNEYYGTLGVASARSVGRVPAVVRAYLALRELRVVQLLGEGLDRARGAIAGARGGDGGGADLHGTLMARLAEERTIRYGSPLQRAGVEQFRSNLDRTLARYAAEEIPVYVGTVASNERDLRPFVSEPGEGVDSVAWRDAIDEAAAALASGDPVRALARLDRAVERDSLAPLAWFLRGRALEAAGRRDEAAEAFFRARDYDQLPFRAARDFERVVREVAARRGATVVESRARLAAESPGGVLGRELLLEHVHPRIEGHLLLADAFYEALRATGAIGAWERVVPLDSARARVPVTAVDTLAGALWIEALTSSFPFAPPGAPPLVRGDTMTPTSPVEAIAVGMYRNALPWPEAQRRLYVHYAREGRWADALHAARVLADELPLLPEPRIMAGRAAARLGRTEEAVAAFTAADGLAPSSRTALLAGAVLAAGGDRTRALPYYERAVQRSPGDRGARLALQAFEALPGLEAGVEETPGDAAAWTNLAGAYLVAGLDRAAAEAARRALALDAEVANARTILERAEAGADDPGSLEGAPR